MAATKKEIAVEEKLKHLYSLQKIDSKLVDITILKGELPDEVQDLEDTIAGYETRIQKHNDVITDKENEISELRASIKDLKAKIDKYESQLNDVKNNREFDALTKEIELKNLDVQIAEKRIREQQEVVEDRKSKIEDTKSKIVKSRELLELKKVELEKIIKDTEEEEEQLLKKRANAIKKVEDRLVSAYTRISQSYRNGLAVATIDRDSCSGCFNIIPPQTQLEIAARQKIHACEHCGRILVDRGYVFGEDQRYGSIEEEERPRRKRTSRKKDN